jgi:hypothetical protein
MNAFSEKEWNNPDRIEIIELVLEDIGRMNIIGNFRNLKQLTLINVSLMAIEVFNIVFINFKF